MPSAARAAKVDREEMLSLAAPAGAIPESTMRVGQFRVLVRHFLERFFTSELASADGDARTRLVQVACTMGIPGLLVALYLYPVYHLPRAHRASNYWGSRPYWAQAGDHYFYVLYAFVAMGLLTIFEWDLFFPDLLDVYVLSSLPLRNLHAFGARVTAIFLLMGAALFDASFLAPLVLPAAADPPHLLPFLAAHLLAVATAGIFGATFFLALEGMLLGVAGDRLFRKVSLWLQGICVTLLLTMLLLYPVFFSTLQRLTTGSRWALAFPPFWFLGIYEKVLNGSAAPAFFAQAARIGWAGTLAAAAVAAVSYPLAWWRRTTGLIEGGAKREKGSRTATPASRILHRLLARSRGSRAIWQFIGQNLLRVPRYRMVLVMVGGAGAALVLATVLRAQVIGGQVRFVLSAQGLRATVPIVAFWTVAGFRSTFLAPADQRGRWIFRAILGKAGAAQALATQRWVVCASLLFTTAAAAVCCLAGGAALRNVIAAADQILVAIALAVLLTDIFFLNVRTIPFTGEPSQHSTNFALLLIPYLGFFPALVLFTVAAEPWIEASALHLAIAAVLALAAHLLLARVRRTRIADFARFADLDEDGDAFPLTLGLRE
jgi:hypothetical protein